MSLNTRGVRRAGLWVCSAVSALAQLYSGSLAGVVRDPSGGVVAAVVSLRDAARGTTRSAMADGSGRYLFRAVAPGVYVLRVTAEGFAPYERPGVVVTVNSALAADVTLGLAEQREQVHVEAGEAALGNATRGLVLARRLLSELPLVSRNPFDLAFLAPGVSQAPGTGYGQGVGTPGFITNFVSDGSRNAQADFLLDGVSVMNSDNNPGVRKALYLPPVEALEEFRVEQTNFSAEFGNSGGTVVNAVTRTGTNALHGEVFEYLRNNLLNANSSFANAAGLGQAHLTRSDFGVALGGPVIRNRTFFFGDFNGIRALTGVTSKQVGVPDAAQRRGDFGGLCGRANGTFDEWGVCSNPAGQIFDPYTGTPNAQNQAVGRRAIPFNNLATYMSPGNTAIPFGLGSLAERPGNLIDPVGAKLINAFPLPNLNVGTAAYDPYRNWVSQGANRLGQQSFDVHVDHHFGGADVAAVKVSREWDASENANFFGSVYDTNTQGPTKHAAVLGSVNVVHTVSARTVVNLSAGYGRNQNPTEGVAAPFGGFDVVRMLGMPSYMNTSGFRTPPSVSISGSYGCNGFNGCLGGQAFSVLRFASETGHVVGSVSHVAGSHEIKAGGEVRRHRINFMQAGAPNGLFTMNAAGTASGTAGVGGDAMATLMVGYVNGTSRYDIPPFTATQNFEMGGFVQDNWRVNGRLTLNLGFRYDVETPRTERYDQMTYFDPAAPATITVPGMSLRGAIAFTGVNGNPRTPFDTYWGQVGPRFGFAYRAMADFVVRGGYGIYYDPSDLGVAGNAVTGGFLGYSASTNGVNHVPAAPWLPLEFLRDPFPYGIVQPTGNRLGAATLLGQAVSGIPVRSLNATPREQAWSFSVRKQVAGSMQVEAAYVGRRGTQLYAMGYGNQFGALPAAAAEAFRANPAFYLQQVANPFAGVITGSADLSGATIPRWKLAVPYPQYSAGSGAGVTSSFAPWASSSYHSAQVTVERRLSRGLQFLFSYTFQKSIDDSSIGSSGYSFLVSGGAVSQAVPRDPNNLRLDRALSSFSIPRIAQVSWVYRLPVGGLQVSGMYRMDSGLPVQLSLCSGCSVNVPTYGNQHPDLTGRLVVTGNVNQYFANPQVAARPAAYTVGSAPRVLPDVRIPGTNNFTAALMKQVALGFREGARMEFRLEAFNALNRVQFAGPDTRVGNAAFGKITAQANQPRQVQVAVKLHF